MLKIGDDEARTLAEAAFRQPKEDEKNAFPFTRTPCRRSLYFSVQMMNDIEGCRRWPSEKTLSKLANALQTDAYTLFLPEDSTEQVSQLQKQTIADDLQKLFAQSVEQYLQNHDLNGKNGGETSS